jgi:serine/threonine protein kinase
MATTGDAARAAWHEYTGKKTVKVDFPEHPRHSDGPFPPIGSKLGEGGFGSVYKINLVGNHVALKITRVFSLKDQDGQLREFRNLEKLSGSRHHHIIELVGCFELKRKNVFKVGLLMWPVAQCNLSVHLEELDNLASLSNKLKDISLMMMSYGLVGPSPRSHHANLIPTAHCDTRCHSCKNCRGLDCLRVLGVWRKP